MDKITVHDVAQRAGVSIATVSRVLNRKGSVTEETAVKVVNAAKELGYHIPNNFDSAIEGKSRVIAVLVPYFYNPFFTDIIDGMRYTATLNGYNIIVAEPHSEYNPEINLINFLSKGVIDGIITISSLVDMKEFLMKTDPNIPIVQCSEYDEELPYPLVSIDDFSATYNAISYLNSIGRSRIAFINSSLKFGYAKRREDAFRKALSDFQLELREDWIYRLNAIDFNMAFASSMDLFAMEEKPDAVFCVSDIYAAAAIRAAHRSGISVPQDVAIVGFDNTDVAMMTDPPITSVNQPRRTIGATACSMLLALINKEPVPSERVFIDTELVLRSSTQITNYVHNPQGNINKGEMHYEKR